MRKLFPVLVLVSTYVVGQAYTLFPDNPLSLHNWILFDYVPMTTAWNVKYLSEEINRILEAIAFAIMLKDRKIYGFVAISYLSYRVLDIIFYFINFKTYDYGWVFVLVALFEALWWFKNDINKAMK